MGACYNLFDSNSA